MPIPPGTSWSEPSTPAASSWLRRLTRTTTSPMPRSLLNRARPEPGRPDLRGWEYWYLRNLCEADLHPGMRHTRRGLELHPQPGGLPRRHGVRSLRSGWPSGSGIR